MELSENFTKSEYSVEDLEQFRDKRGFIDLSKAGINFTAESREIIGNPNRVKNWVDFNGKKALIKGEAILEEEKNYGIYAELIVEEIAKKFEIPTAHYDLIKMIDDNGNEILGVLSESVVNVDKGEELVSLRSIIGDEPEEEGDFVDITGYEYTVKKLRENLAKDGYDEEQIESVISNYKKRLAFTLSIIDTDKHTENVAFIKKKINGKDILELSPNFDSESSLMLDNDITIVDKLLADYQALKESVNIADPRIGILRTVEEGGYDSLWMDTLDELCDDDEVYDYCSEVLKKPLDMDDILDSVEKRIKAQLPKEVKLLAKYSYNSRNEEMSKVIEGGILEQEEQDFWNVESLLKSLIGRGTQENIRTGEQMDIGKEMKKDMIESPEVDIEDIINEIFNEKE